MGLTTMSCTTSYAQGRRAALGWTGGTRPVRADRPLTSGGVFDWNPNDPDAVKVHYDVSAWTLDQRAELTAALADDDIPHVWEGDELVVPEEVEPQTDELFSRLEEVLGPFAIRLDEDEASVEFGLDEWPTSDRDTLTAALVEGGIPHRWEGTTVFVPADAEEVVDDLLDSIESGTLVVTGGDGTAGPPDHALSTLFAAADRLAKDPDDHVGQTDLAELVDVLELGHPPYGVPAGTWSKVIDTSARLIDLCDATEPSPSEIIGAAQDLRSLVRQYV